MLESSQIARKSVGYSGAALALLCSDAAFRSVLRSKQLVDPREEVPPRLLESLSVSQHDFHVSSTPLYPVFMYEFSRLRWRTATRSCTGRSSSEPVTRFGRPRRRPRRRENCTIFSPAETVSAFRVTAQYATLKLSFAYPTEAHEDNDWLPNGVRAPVRRRETDSGWTLSLKGSASRE